MKNKDLIPLIKDYWWLRTPGNDIDRASYVIGNFGEVFDDGFDIYLMLGVRPVLKVEYYDQLKVGEKIKINNLYFTVLNDGILLCDTIVNEVMFDEMSNNYNTSYIKTWIEEWAENIILN